MCSMVGGSAMLPSGLPSSAPRKIQSQWSVPELNCQRPLKTYPPSVGTARPVGAYGEAIQVLSSVPQTSPRTLGSANASCHGCTPTTPQIHPAAPSSDATAITVSANSLG